MFNFGGNKFADRDPQNYINSLLGYKSKIQLSPHGEKINDITSEDIVQIANLLFVCFARLSYTILQRKSTHLCA